jgi:hypothetical protein
VFASPERAFLAVLASSVVLGVGAVQGLELESSMAHQVLLLLAAAAPISLFLFRFSPLPMAHLAYLGDWRLRDPIVRSQRLDCA